MAAPPQVRQSPERYRAGHDPQIAGTGGNSMTEYEQAVAASHIPGDALAAMVDDWSLPETAETVADLEDRWLGEDATAECWAEEYLHDTGLLSGLDDSLRPYFDCKAWLDDCVLAGDLSVVVTEKGVGVFHN